MGRKDEGSIVERRRNGKLSVIKGEKLRYGVVYITLEDHFTWYYKVCFRDTESTLYIGIANYLYIVKYLN